LSEDHDEADLSAQQPPPQADPWIPRPDADERGPAGAQAAPPEGAQAPGRVGRATLRPAQRLHAAADFQRLLRGGLRAEGALFLLVASENGRRADRLGLVLPRRLGDATARNRMKRLLREAFRQARRPSGPGLDLLLLPRSEILKRKSQEVRREFEERLRRVSTRLARRSDAAARR